MKAVIPKIEVSADSSASDAPKKPANRLAVPKNRDPKKMHFPLHVSFHLFPLPSSLEFTLPFR